MSNTISKEAEKRVWPFLGYAPGNYMNTCSVCKKDMKNVDKLCFVCLECAVRAADDIMSQPIPNEKGDEVQSEWEFVTIVTANYIINKNDKHPEETWKGFTAQAAAIETYEDMLEIIRGLPLKRSSLPNPSPNQDYWKERCEAAEQLVGIPLIQSPGRKKLYDKWQSLKQINNG